MCVVARAHAGREHIKMLSFGEPCRGSLLEREGGARLFGHPAAYSRGLNLV